MRRSCGLRSDSLTAHNRLETSWSVTNRKSPVRQSGGPALNRQKRTGGSSGRRRKHCRSPTTLTPWSRSLAIFAIRNKPKSIRSASRSRAGVLVVSHAILPTRAPFIGMAAPVRSPRW